MLPKDIHPDNYTGNSSEGAAAEMGNSALEQSVLDRYTGNGALDRHAFFAQRTAHRELAGEKCLSLASDLTQRWKRGAGTTSLAERPLPFLRRVFRAGTESCIGEKGVSEAQSTPQPVAHAVISPRPDSKATGPQVHRAAASRGGDFASPPPARDTADDNKRPEPDIPRARTIGQKPRPGRQTAVDTNMPDMSLQIIKRHDSPSLARKYRRPSDNFHFLREKSELSRTLGASHRNPLRETRSDRERTVISRRSVNSALRMDSHALTKSRVTRQAVEMAGGGGHRSENPQTETAQSAGNNGDTYTKKEIFLFNESSEAAPLFTRDHTLFTGFRPLLMRIKTDSTDNRTPPVMDFQSSVDNNGTPAEQDTQGAASFSQVARQSSGLPHRHDILTDAMDTVGNVGNVTGLAGTRISRTENVSASAPGLPAAKAAHIYPSYANRNDGGTAAGFGPSDDHISLTAHFAGEHVSCKSDGSDSIFTFQRYGTICPANVFQPLTARGNTAIMRGIFRRRDAATLASGTERLQLIRPGQSSGLPPSSEGRQRRPNSVKDSTRAESGPTGYPGFPFSAGHNVDEPVNTGAGLKPGKLSGPMDAMPLLNRKKHAGPEVFGTGNGGMMDRVAGRHDSSGFLQRSAVQNGGSDTSSQQKALAAPAVNVSQAGPAAEDKGSAPLDLERIADEVYLIIERRLIVEKERKGL